MKPTMSLAWKEWHEVRAFLWIGLGVFLGLPLLGGLEEWFSHVHRFHLWTTGWVVGFGGVLAVFVAVGATCRDFNGHLEDFWRSRPIGALRWLLVKYTAGLVVVLTACVVPLVVELVIERDTDAREFILLFPFLWTAIYSIGFLAGCLIRKTAQSAMIGLAGMLLLSFLPMILPPLRWIDAMSVSDRFGGYPWTERQWECAGGLAGVAIFLLALAVLAVKNGWRVESGRKMMYGSVASAILILFASAAFQLGTNLPILQQVDLPAGENAAAISNDGSDAFVITVREAAPGKDRTLVPRRRTIDISTAGIKVGSSTHVSRWFGYGLLPEERNPRYFVDEDEFSDKEDAITLDIVYADKDEPVEVAQLWKQSPKAPSPVHYAVRNRLYVIGTHLDTLDISEPLKPRVISDVPFSYSFQTGALPIADRLDLILPPVPGLAPRDRLIVGLKGLWPIVFDGDTLCGWNDELLVGYRLSDLTEKTASFTKIGQHESTMLERVFGSYRYGEMKMANGLLYLSEYGGGGWTFNAHITVFDTRGPSPMRSVGHFAFPDTWGLRCCPLPDGTALIGGTKIWLVGPPPRRNAE